MTITRHLLILLIPALAILGTMGGVVDYVMTMAATHDAYDQALLATARAVAASIRDASAQSTPPAWMSAADIPGGMLALFDAHGRLVAGSPQLAATPAAHRGAPTFADADIAGRAMRVVALAVPQSDGFGTLRVAQTVTARLHTARVLFYGKWLLDFVELDIALLLICLGVYVGLRPLRRLEHGLQARAAGEFGPVDEALAPRELQPLVRTFNRLSDLLHEAAQSQRRFVADAAHQMRTPIAGIMGQLELLMQRSESTSIKADLDKIHRGVAHLARSANQLLSLARVEPFAQQTLEFRPVALRGLVEDVVDRQLNRAEALGIDLGAEASDAGVRGDRTLLDDLLSNLVDNALKYTPRGGGVTVRCGVHHANQPYLEVEDDGPGIPPEDRPRVCERFYRGRNASGPGCGLGLAIVEEITHIHRASFQIADTASGRGVRLRVSFPAATAAP